MNDPEITQENDDPYVSVLNCLSKHKLEALLKNKYTHETIFFSALDNIRTIGRGSDKGTNTEDEIISIANYIANNPHSSEEVLEYILAVLDREKVSWDKVLDIKLRLHRFLLDLDYDKINAASMDNLSLDFIRQLGRDDDFEVRLNIAQRKNLPEDVVNLLAGDVDNDVRSAIMNNYELTEDLVRRLVDPSNQGKAGPTVDLHEMVEFIIAQRTALPADVVAILSKHNCSDVRLEIAKREYLPSDIVGKLLQDPDEDVRNLIEFRFDLLSTHPDWNIRWKCADNYHCPIEILAILSKDISVEIRSCIARRRYLPETIRDLLIADSDFEVSRSAKENILSPPP